MLALVLPLYDSHARTCASGQLLVTDAARIVDVAVAVLVLVLVPVDVSSSFALDSHTCVALRVTWHDEPN